MHVRKFADDIDPATARDIRIRRFAFSAEHKFFVVEVGIPQVVIDRLRSPDWDRVTYAAKERAAEYVRHWRAQGAPLDEFEESRGGGRAVPLSNDLRTIRRCSDRRGQPGLGSTENVTEAHDVNEVTG